LTSKNIFSTHHVVLLTDGQFSAVQSDFMFRVHHPHAWCTTEQRTNLAKATNQWIHPPTQARCGMLQGWGLPSCFDFGRGAVSQVCPLHLRRPSLLRIFIGRAVVGSIQFEQKDGGRMKKRPARNVW
jgi:hypothetical protein